MVKPLKSGVINLSQDAKASSHYMLEEVMKKESGLKVDHSKLVSFIVNDYKERFFTKSLEKIARAHRDSKKQIKNKLANLSDSQLQALSKALLKIEKENSQHTHTEINTSAV